MIKLPPPPNYLLMGHESSVTAIHFTNETDNAIRFQPSLISGSEHGRIFIWELQSFRTYHKFSGHGNKMIVFLKYYQSKLLSQGRDGILNIWEFADEQWNILRRITSTNVGFCASDFFHSEDNTHLIILNQDKHLLEIYDYEKASKSQTLKLKCFDGMCMCLKSFQIGSRTFILTGHENGSIGLWDCETGSEVSHLKCHAEPVMCLDFDAQHRKQGISGTPEDTLETWKITGNLQILKAQKIAVTNPGTNAVKIRDDGKIVLVAGYDCSIRILSWKTLRPLAVLKFHKLPIQCLAFSPAPVGKRASVFASGSKDKDIALWSIY